VGVLGASGKAYGLTVTPLTNTSAGIQQAIDSLAMTGGTVQLQPITYTFTAPVVVPSGVAILGAGWALSQTMNIPEAGELLASGTICVGNGTFAGFIGNAEDQASPSTALTKSGSTRARAANAFSSNALNGVRIQNLGLKNFTYGLKFGGVNNYGFLRSYVDNVYAENCTVWGVSFENFQYSEFSNIFTRVNASLTDAGGIRFAVTMDSTASGLTPGDSACFNLMAASFHRRNRSIVMETSNSISNQLRNFHITKARADRMDGGNGTKVFNTVSVSNASANIAVANCEYYPVGTPVWFMSTGDSDFTFGNGLNTQGAHQIYFVQSVDRVSGLGNITIGNRWNDSALTPSGAATNYRLYTGGYPGIEVNNKLGNGATHCNFIGIAAEGIHSPGFCGHGVSGGKLNIIDVQPTQITSLVLRFASCIVEAGSVTAPLSTDFDSAAASVQYYGPRSDAVNSQCGQAGTGIWNSRVVAKVDPASVSVGTTGITTTRPGTGTNSCQLQIVAAGAVAGTVATVVLSTLRENYAGYYPTITPANAAAAAVQLTASAVRAQSVARATGFDLVTDTALPNGTYLFNVRW
jgi:hypothetical protein